MLDTQSIITGTASGIIKSLSNDKLSSSADHLNEHEHPAVEALTGRMKSFSRKGTTRIKRGSQSDAAQTPVIMNRQRSASTRITKSPSFGFSPSTTSPPLQSSDEKLDQEHDFSEPSGSVKKENIFLKLFHADPEQLFNLRTPRNSGQFPSNFNILHHHHHNAVSPSTPATQNSHQIVHLDGKDALGNPTSIRVVQYPSGVHHHRRNPENLLAKLFTMHNHMGQQHHGLRHDRTHTGSYSDSDGPHSSRGGSHDNINKYADELNQGMMEPMMSGTLTQPISISRPAGHSEVVPDTADSADSSPILKGKEAWVGGMDFETIAAIGEESTIAEAITPVGSVPEKAHSPFHFFKPMHIEAVTGAAGEKASHSLHGGHGGHGGGDIFKDLLSNHRHRRATSSQPPPVSVESSCKGMQRSLSDAVVSEKYKRHDEILGKGANAVVRLAHKQDVLEGESKLYAVKEFRKRRRGEHPKDYVKKVIAEFCISSSMHHENVIETIDLIQDENDQWCEVMEYMPGGDLYTRISGQTLTDLDEINCFYKQLLAGVTYIHSMGVAHRDLKPENLLLDAEHRILKIADFGVSEVFKTCFEKSSRKAKGVCGSEPYIAPEEWEAEAEYDGAKVDIWACGIIYYTMLCNSVPWRVAKQSDAYYSDYLHKRRPDVASGFFNFDRLHPGPRSLFYKMLEPNPDKRPGAAELLKDEWLEKQEVCRSIIEEEGVMTEEGKGDGKMEGESSKILRKEEGGNISKNENVGDGAVIGGLEKAEEGNATGCLEKAEEGDVIGKLDEGGVMTSTPITTPASLSPVSPAIPILLDKKPKLVSVRHVHHVPPPKH